MLVLAVHLSVAMPLPSIIWTCFLSSVMAVMALVGAMVRSDYKWGKHLRLAKKKIMMLMILRQVIMDFGLVVGLALDTTSSGPRGAMLLL
jgi:bacteriorhodopsin